VGKDTSEGMMLGFSCMLPSSVPTGWPLMSGFFHNWLHDGSVAYCQITLDICCLVGVFEFDQQYQSTEG